MDGALYQIAARGWLIRAGWMPRGCDGEDEVWLSTSMPDQAFTFEDALRFYIGAQDGRQLARHLQPGDVIIEAGIQPLTVQSATCIDGVGLVHVQALGVENDGVTPHVFHRNIRLDALLVIRREASCLLG